MIPDSECLCLFTCFPCVRLASLVLNNIYRDKRPYEFPVIDEDGNKVVKKRIPDATIGSRARLISSSFGPSTSPRNELSLLRRLNLKSIILHRHI